MSMRMPTLSQFKFQAAQMAKQYERVSTLQTQISTGKRILKSSDDPIIASRAHSVSDYIERLKSYEMNTTLAENRLSLVSSNLQEGIDLNTKAQELIIRAQNDTLNNHDRQNIAQELQAILENLVGISNTQDANGEYVFNGFHVDQPAFTRENGEFRYQGGYDGYSITIGEQSQILCSDSGFQVFGNIKSGNGNFSVGSLPGNNTGTGVLNSVNLVNTIDQPVMDNYTLTLVMNDAGQLAYQVTGVNSGQVVPTPPLTIPHDAPEYISGSTISFNGVNVRLDGHPALGDSFVVKPSEVQSVFKTLENVINALSTPVTSDKSKADLKQILSEQSTSLSQAGNHLISQLTDVANRAKKVDDQIQLNKNQIFDEQIILSRLSDADMTQSISELTQQLTSLNITQQSYLKIQETFLQLLNR